MFYVHVSHDDLLQSYMLAHDNLLIDQSHKLRQRSKTGSGNPHSSTG